jgi:hypothetical protein
MIETDIIIIGAGPVGLFTVFEAGLLKLRCHLIDSLPVPGGQLIEIYPKKPIYDIPGYPIVNAGELVDKLMEQNAVFKPGFTLGESATTLEETADGKFIVTTIKGTKHKAPIVIIAGGLGVFEPRKPPIEHLEKYEDKGVEYTIRDPEFYKGLVHLFGGEQHCERTFIGAPQNFLPRAFRFRAKSNGHGRCWKNKFDHRCRSSEHCWQWQSRLGYDQPCYIRQHRKANRSFRSIVWLNTKLRPHCRLGT